MKVCLPFGSGIYTVTLAKTTYVSNGRLAVFMFLDGEGLFGNLTKNIEDAPILSDRQACIDTNNLGESIEQWLIDNKIAVSTGLIARSGFCAYPVMEFLPNVLDAMPGMEDY
ncbi:DUF4313 domain-containing protein [Actinomyces vulturis]|uniref:DUF4313 domain-containing protein n=1 Tax=Actinomyces vulturis TaxID=1857645 RepID=UPI00082F8E18|nr:DUF4313 domain-containing protein [Actinomyces vulturis]